MIDPLLTLAFGVHANKGAYALLLGSGVSRGAGIPTGWEIVEDLIRKVAKLQGVSPEPDPFAWYSQTFHSEPDYSNLLNELAPTPAERRRILSQYFEPTPEERAQNIKLPTAAHKAIAKLVAGGHIRVILTTNFDRLIEHALEEAGITPTVVSTVDAIAGAPPLSQATNLVVKLHGDYLDHRIRNTAPELSSYDPKMNLLLDRVLDEFGLIVCGWSADWDAALRAAVERCPSRRYSTYWSVRHPIAGEAKRLAELRSAIVVGDKDADAFFVDLAEKVQSLNDIETPHPLSAKVAVATLKRHLSEDRQGKIRFHDLILDAVESIRTAMKKPPLSELQVPSVQQRFKAIVDSYDAACSTAASLLAVAAYWGRAIHLPVLVTSVERLADIDETQGGMVCLLNLRRYPALIATYAAGLGAFAAARYDVLAALLTKPKATLHSQRTESLIASSAWRVFAEDADKRLFPENQQKRFPVSHHLRRVMRPPLHDLVPSDTQYDAIFDRFEAIVTLVHADLFDRACGPMGEYVIRRFRGRGEDPLQPLMEELQQSADKHPMLVAGLFNGSYQRFRDIKREVDGYIAQYHY
ncbi:MAG: SIR2 family protein [Tepidisphaeraceae bacterium]|jgi:hypothetical protein